MCRRAVQQRNAVARQQHEPQGRRTMSIDDSRTARMSPASFTESTMSIAAGSCSSLAKRMRSFVVGYALEEGLRCHLSCA